MVGVTAQTWSTLASLATALGTLILAISTFAAVRSANRASRASERLLLTGLQPILVPSRPEDPLELIRFGDDHWVEVGGGRGSAELAEHAVYLALALRNVGQGLAVLDGWHLVAEELFGADDADHAPMERFRRLTRDIYVPGGFIGFWQGALREDDDPVWAPVRQAIEARRTITVELLYADLEGGQRMVTRFLLTAMDDGGWAAAVSRHWTLDRDDPR